MEWDGNRTVAAVFCSRDDWKTICEWEGNYADAMPIVIPVGMEAFKAMEESDGQAVVVIGTADAVSGLVDLLPHRRDKRRP